MPSHGVSWPSRVGLVTLPGGPKASWCRLWSGCQFLGSTLELLRLGTRQPQIGEAHVSATTGIKYAMETWIACLQGDTGCT